MDRREFLRNAALVGMAAVQTNDEAWEIVETCEKARRHCMMLENCIYGEMELLAWNLAHRGLLGTLTHAEGGYIHNLAWRHLEDHPRNRDKMVPGYVEHDYGNTYPTHALGPICTYMDMNRGDRMETVLSVSSLAATSRAGRTRRTCAGGRARNSRRSRGNTDIRSGSRPARSRSRWADTGGLLRGKRK